RTVVGQGAVLRSRAAPLLFKRRGDPYFLEPAGGRSVDCVRRRRYTVHITRRAALVLVAAVLGLIVVPAAAALNKHQADTIALKAFSPQGTVAVYGLQRPLLPYESVV